MDRENKPKLMNRLKRIEGQVRGIGRMVDEDRYCVDIMTQLQAVRAALTKVETELMREHIDHCVTSAFSSGDPEEQRQKTDELVTLLQRTMR